MLNHTLKQPAPYMNFKVNSVTTMHGFSRTHLLQKSHLLQIILLLLKLFFSERQIWQRESMYGSLMFNCCITTVRSSWFDELGSNFLLQNFQLELYFCCSFNRMLQVIITRKMKKMSTNTYNYLFIVMHCKESSTCIQGPSHIAFSIASFDFPFVYGENEAMFYKSSMVYVVS